MFVFRIIPFILILKCSAVTTYSESENNSTIKTQINPPTVNKTTDSPQRNKLDNKEKIATIIGEGGERLVTTMPPLNITSTISSNEDSDIKTKSTPSSSTTRIYGREGIKIDNISKNISKTLNGTIEKTQTSNNTDEILLNKTANESKQHNITKPISEVPISIDDKSSTTRSGSVPRKGVEFTTKELNPTTASTITTKKSTTTVKSTTVQTTAVVKQVHKPTVTTGSEDNKDALIKEKLNNSTPKVPTIEYYQKNKEDKRSTFVIPIVAVILSVPLVAIILNILYKHGKEWWSHRHYRRMDFLIDGMYNN